MKVIHLIGGGDEGGAKSHVLQLIKELGKYIKVTLVSYRKGHFHDDAVKMGIDAHIIHSGNIFRDIRKTLRLVRSGKYDIIHAHGAKGNMIATIIKKITGIPVVTTVHSDYRLDYIHSIWKRYSFGIINMIALRHINYHIAVSSSLKNILIERGFNPQNLHLVNNGIPFDNDIPECTRKEFFQRFNVPFHEDCDLIGIMARLHPVKDHETFLKAAAEVVKVNPNARFLICGPGDDLMPHLKQFAKKLNIDDYVHFTGKVDTPYDFFQIIDINVLTSISEGFPYVILEGARFEKVFVGTRVGGLADLVDSGHNGYLVEPKDWKTLAGYLIELTLDKNKRELMGKALKEKAEAEFSLRKMCETQLSIYSTILKNEEKFKKDNKLYDISILGYYGYKNSGDEAILHSILNSFRKIDPSLNYVVFSKNTKETRKTYLVESINRFNILKVYKCLRRSRLFLAGGGSLIQDCTSTRSIIFYLGILRMAKRAGSKTMLFSNGIGPIRKPFNRHLAKLVLNELTAISLRDSKSFEEIKTLGIDKPYVYLTSDPAILMEPCEKSSVDKLIADEQIPADKKLVGFSIRKWGDTKYYDKIAKIADFCVEHLNLHPVFIPMQYPCDLDASLAIAKLMKHPATIIKGMYCPPTMLGFVSRLEILVGMRLHSLIYAANQCIPMVGLVYEPKVEAFLKEINQPSAGKPEDLNEIETCTLIEEVLANRQKLVADLTKSRDRLRILAKGNMYTAYDILINK
ncbi:MAG: polysaccharide pyruvyl transferase CsaB [Clostridiaceae bacterium]|nr:polysaccharide pyruvyl transferase CsaB [Clostridiaceae bacterium]